MNISEKELLILNGTILNKDWYLHHTYNDVHYCKYCVEYGNYDNS